MASVSNSLVITKGKLDAQGIGVYTGSCDTEGNAFIKICTFDKEVAPLDGVQISITFSHANTAANVSLRVGKSEFPVYAGSKPLTNTSVNGWADNQTVNFMCSHEKWYMTSISSADIMEFSSKDGEGATLDIYSSKENGFKASLGNTSLAFKYKKNKDSEDKVIAQYDLGGVSLYSTAEEEKNPYAKFGATTILGYTDKSHLEAGEDFLSMYDVPNKKDGASEYFRVSRNVLAFKADDNNWFGISKTGKLGLLNSEDFSISKSTMNGTNENLLKDTEKTLLFTNNQKDNKILVTDFKKIIKEEIYTLSFKATSNKEKTLALDLYYENKKEPFYSLNISKEEVINFKWSFKIESDNVGFIRFLLTDNTPVKEATAVDEVQTGNEQSIDFLLRIEGKTLKLEKGDVQTDWCFPIDYPQITSNALEKSSQALERQLTITQYLLGLNDQDAPSDWGEEYNGCWGVEKDGDKYSLVTNFLSANVIKAGTLKSLSYNEVEGDIFSKEGFCIDLSSGSIKSPALSLIQEKDEETEKTTSLLSVKGNIEASSGKIGDFIIDSGGLSFSRVENDITTATITISSGENFLLCKSNDQENSNDQKSNLKEVFSVSKDGSLFATKGTIGGLKITESSLSSHAEEGLTPGFRFSQDGTFSLGGDAIIYNNKKVVISSETVISSLATKNKAVEINNGDFPIQLTSNGNNLKMNSSGIIMSGTVDSKEFELIKLSTEGNISNIIVGNSAKDNSHISISSSQVDIETPGNGKMTLSGTDFSVNTKEIAGTPASFSLNDKFVYNSKIGFLLTSASGKKTLDDIIEKKGNQDISTYLGWITQNDTSDQKNVNLIATNKGLGFFSDGSPQTPIAYFTKDKLYVKRTQVLDRQQISSFIWQSREGSNYLRTNERNIGLKWLVNKKEG